MPVAEFFVDNLGSLSDWLLSAPGEDELDERGCLSKEQCQKIDIAVLKEVEPRIKGFYVKEPPHGTNPNNKWRTASGLQKAIRFGLADHAAFCASVLYDMDSAYLRRRLGVIAVEDVGGGNLFAMCAALAMMGHQHWRKALDERRFYMWLARELAAGWKDRTYCDLITLVYHDASVDKETMAKWGDKKLLDTAFEHDKVLHRATALSMFGAKERSATPLFREMAKRGMSRLGLWVSARTLSRVQDDMWTQAPLVDEWLKLGVCWLQPNVLPAMPFVGKLLGAAYDQHTREGQAAIMKFFRETKELHPFINACPADRQRWLKMNSVFRAEGGLLNRQVFYGQGRWVFEQVGLGENRYAAVLPPELASTLIPTVQKHLPDLNAAREKVLYAALKKAS